MSALSLLRALDALQIIYPGIRARSCSPPPLAMAQCWQVMLDGRPIAKMGSTVSGDVFLIDSMERRTTFELVGDSIDELAGAIAALAGESKVAEAVTE